MKYIYFTVYRFRSKLLFTLIGVFCLASMGTANAQRDVLKAAGVDNAAVASAYYKTIDPDDERLTQDAWEEVNGFNAPENRTIEAAGYFNLGDLGFYRRIEMVVDKRPGYAGNIAFTTFNYTNETDSLFDDDDERKYTAAASIVNMEYSPGPEGEPITKFYVYANAKDGERLLSTTFSVGGEELFVPAACYSCHGGDDDEGSTVGSDGYNEGSGETNGGFIAFDYRTMFFPPATSRAALEPAIRKFNVAILHTDPSRGVKELVKGLYGGHGLPRRTQLSNYVPADWRNGREVTLYRRVVVPSCLSCHTLSDKKLMRLSYWKNNPDKIRKVVFKKHFMPNAIPSYNRLFGIVNPLDPVVVDEQATFLDRILRRFGSN